MNKKICFLLFTFVFQTALHAKVTAGKDSVNGEPLTWSIDLFDELQKDTPTIASRKVYYMLVAKNAMFDNTRINYESTTKRIPIERKDKQTSFKPEGQLAKPGDIITLSYNQKLQIYVPYLNKLIWIIPTKQRKVIFSSHEITTEKPELLKKTDPEKNVFKLTPEQQKAEEEAEASAVTKAQ